MTGSDYRYELYYNYAHTNNLLQITNPTSKPNVIYKFTDSLLTVADFSGNILASKNKSTYTPPSISNNFTMYLFKRHSLISSEKCGLFKVYYCKISNNGNPVLNLIPVKRVSDNVVCMYDTISDTYFENIGTGNFVAGPELEV